MTNDKEIKVRDLLNKIIFSSNPDHQKTIHSFALAYLCTQDQSQEDIMFEYIEGYFNEDIETVEEMDQAIDKIASEM